LDVDIAELILSDHHEQRRMFALLDDIERDDTATLGAVWTRLRILLEVHAEAEEQLFYPRLLDVGVGVGSKDSASAETKDAIHDHNQIRDGIAKAGQHQVGSDAWWAAVADTREANSDHMGEEERESLADFRRHADLATRHTLGIAFAAFEADHAGGITSRDRDPDQYVREQ
jgi:hypothetical protein